MSGAETFTAFDRYRQIGAGDLLSIARAAAGHDGPILVFDDASGRQVDLDLRFGPEHAVRTYLEPTRGDPTPQVNRRGRPKLGVVAREVTLLPRHWDWLATQPGGASAALRRLVEEARRSSAGPDGHRLAREALYRAMSGLAGDLPGFEEASRALFAGQDLPFDAIVAAWPLDVAAYVNRLANTERIARSAA